MSSRALLLLIALVALFQSAVAKPPSDPNSVTLNAYLIDKEQLKQLHDADATPLVQKRECDFVRRRYFIVVVVQNRGDLPITGKLSVTYEGRKDFQTVEVKRLEPQMAQPDYFIWPVAGAAVAHGKEPSRIEASWTKLSVISSARSK